MVKYLVKRMCKYLTIFPWDYEAILDENGNVKDEFNEAIICDTFEEAEEFYEEMLEEQHGWLLLRSKLKNSVRVVEYVDGPTEDYLEDTEFIGGFYLCRHAAEEDANFIRREISRYYIIGNRNTGELRETFYEGGFLSAYFDKDEVVIGESKTSANSISALYIEYKDWTEKWEEFYNSKFMM